MVKHDDQLHNSSFTFSFTFCLSKIKVMDVTYTSVQVVLIINEYHKFMY